MKRWQLIACAAAALFMVAAGIALGLNQSPTLVPVNDTSSSLVTIAPTTITLPLQQTTTPPARRSASTTPTTVPAPAPKPRQAPTSTTFPPRDTGHEAIDHGTTTTTLAPGTDGTIDTTTTTSTTVAP